MKISTRTRYGARFLIHLAMAGGGAPVPLSEIARSQEISWKYLGSIASALKTAGFVKTSVGAGGGFRLARSPERITLHDVFSAFEGRVSLVPCVPAAARCRRAGNCAARTAWDAVNSALERSLKAVTIAAMAAEQAANNRAKQPRR